MSISGRSAARLLLGLAVSVAAGFWVLRDQNLNAVGAALGQATWGWLGLVIITEGVALALHAYRARLLLASHGEVGWGHLIRSRALVLLGNDVLPFRAGEWLRVGYLARFADLKLAQVIGLTAIERALDAVLFAGILALAAGALEQVQVRQLATVGVALGASLLALGVAVRLGPAFFERHLPARLEKFRQHLRSGLHDALVAVRSAGRRGAVVRLGLMHVLYASTAYAAWDAIFAAFHLSLPWYAPSVVTGFVAFGTALPAGPAFVGTFEAFASAALVTLGVAPETALAVAVASHALAIALHLLFGIPVIPALFVLAKDRPPSEP